MELEEEEGKSGSLEEEGGGRDEREEREERGPGSDHLIKGKNT